ncbi:MAG: PAS domain S-box protein, partial [Alphaproteobacteria bacterium]|nr:PAS domain S-box protein [Alphaproteobacteria bacterium]
MTLPEQVAARIAQNHETHHISDVRKLFAETLERPLGPQIHAQAVDDLQRRITLRSSLVSLLLTIVAAVAVFVGSGILLQEFDEKHVAAFLAGPAATTREMSGEGLAPLAAVLADQHSWLGRTQVEFWRGSERVGQFGHAVGFFPATWVKTLGDSEISIRVMRSRWERLLASFAYVIAISVVFTSVILLAVGPLMREIANRRRAQIEAQTALAASEERFKGIASLSADMFWEVDAEGRLAFIVTSGQGRLEQLGGVMEQITGQNVGALLDQLGPTARTGFEKHFAARESFSGLQMDGQTATGPLHLVSNGRPLFDDDGNFTGYQGATRDVTDLVVAQTEANTATNLIQSLFENSPAAIVVKGLDGSFIRKNRTFAAWAGSATTPPTGKAHIGLPVSADEEWFAELDRQVLETVRPVQGERTVTYGDGTKRRLSTVKCPLLDEHGQLTGIGVITSDVTKLHETEERLSRAQKLEAIGQLTGGVAHD